jgi:hypothetical protein
MNSGPPLTHIPDPRQEQPSGTEKRHMTPADSAESHESPESPETRKDGESLEEWISEARLAETTVTVYGRSDLLADHQELVAELAALDADDPGATRMSGSPRTRLARRIVELEDQMRRSAKTFRFRAATPDEMKTCDKEHAGDPEAIAHALLSIQVVSPLVRPDQWGEISEKIGAGQFQGILNAASEVAYQRQVSVPFSQAASAILSIAESSQS